MTIIAIANKGGVGKTTAVNLAASLAVLRKSFIDRS